MVVIGATDTVFNTFKLSSKERAAKALSENVIPAVRAALAAFKETDVEQFALFLTYGSKDFTKKDDTLNLEAEIVALITAKADAASFASAEITDQELADKSVILPSDRDAFFSFARIKPVLE